MPLTASATPNTFIMRPPVGIIRGQKGKRKMSTAEITTALHLNQSAINTANNQSMFNAGDTIAKEARRVYRAGLAEIYGAIEEPNAEQERIISERAASWRELCEKSFNDEISRRASWVPWSVCGPANYPAERMNKRADRAMQAAGEWDEKRARFLNNTLSMLRKAVPVADIIAEYRSGKNSEPIASDDPAAPEKLAARIEYLKELHEEGKARNAYYRKHHTMKGYKDLTDAQAEELDAAIDKAFLYHVPYAPYEVSNNLQNIKRLEGRLTEISRAREERETGSVPADETGEGFRVIYSAADCRINIKFDGKPDAETRAVLKSNGFHWSPRELHWTRKDTPNARQAVEYYILPALKNSAK